MKRLALIAGVHFALCGLWAQERISQFTVVSDYPQVRFRVDGKEYRGSVTFMWLEGTRHTLQYEGREDGYQYDGLETTRWNFAGWEESTGLLFQPALKTQMIIASPEITSFKLKVNIEYRVRLLFFDAPLTTPPSSDSPPVCAAPGDIPPDEFRPGVVILAGTCYWNSVEQWMPPGTQTLNAYPYPGFVFLGWSAGGGGPNTFVRTLNVIGPTTLIAHFAPGKRVRFITDPPGFEVLLDRIVTPTPHTLPCDERQMLPPAAPAGASPLCVGEADWALGSQHVVGVPSPQTDSHGNLWVLDSFSNGMGNHSTYKVESLMPPETIVARFVRGARVSFVTNPTGLKLAINGRDNWPAYNFVAAPGETYQISAASEQVDSNGRRYTLLGWSNGGEAAQEVTIPEEAVTEGFRLTAHYDLLSQVVIRTTPAGTPVEVDGLACDTPCPVDRPDGAEVQIVAPAQRSISNSHRLEFASWDDGAPRERTITVSGQESQVLTAVYSEAYLLETSSDPPGGASFQMEPASADGFYAGGTAVAVTALAEDGYRFRRWGGDLEGTYSTGYLTMSGPHSVVALLDDVAFIPPAVVRNAAGETPEEVVAAGSIISIYGANLAPYIEVGPSSPLMQTLAGVTVRVASRILALMFVSPEQINAVLPGDLAEGTHTLTVSWSGQPDVNTEFTVVRSAPGLFSRIFDSRFFALAAHEDGSPITPDSPARRGELIRLYGTGFGPYDLIAPYGFGLPEAPEFRLVDPVEIFAGDLPLQPEWAGGATGYCAMDEMRLRITDDLPAASTLEVKASVHGRESNTVLLPVE